MKVYPQGKFIHIYILYVILREAWSRFDWFIGVTTNSALGITSYDEFFPVFAAMEKHDLVLNLHGEVPSGPRSDITDLTAEEAFLPTLIELNQRFPKLRIVLEHCSTVAAIAAVRACGPSVAGELISQSQLLVIPFSLFFLERRVLFL